MLGPESVFSEGDTNGRHTGGLPVTRERNSRGRRWSAEVVLARGGLAAKSCLGG